jgi:hypothetical protein
MWVEREVRRSIREAEVCVEAVVGTGKGLLDMNRLVGRRWSKRKNDTNVAKPSASQILICE